MSDLFKRIAGLSPQKLALLMQHLKEKNNDVPQIKPISRRKERDVYPLSFAQQRLWFIDQLEPGNYAHNILTAIRFTGLLNQAALEQAINEIVRRHEVLRMTFHVTDGQPCLVLTQALTQLLPVIDLQDLPEAEREAEMIRWANIEVLLPFDLSKGPMLRTTLVRLDMQEHVLLFTMHHIVSDGWSRGVLIQEFSTLYNAFFQGASSPLPELPIQYADYAAWQREWLQGETLSQQLAYWKQQIEEAAPVLELPTDRVRPTVQTLCGARYRFVLPGNLTAALEELARQEGVTLFIVLLAAFNALLVRYTCQEKVVVGSPVANRSRIETEGLIGFFANTLALQTDLSGNPSFRELLARVRKVALGAYAHQELPFEKLVEELRPERDLSRTPLFQVMFLLDNTPMETLELPGLRVNPIDFDGKISAFDLSMHLEERPAGVRGALEYNTDLFDEVTIERMVRCFQQLLAGIAVNLDLRLLEIPLLSDTERHQLVVEWNDTEAAYPHETCVHELFEAQAEQTPDSVAVVVKGKQLSYQELNQRANQLAHHLQSLGVGPDVLVGICVERSLEMIVGLLGVLKAGGAYVPLDPVYPQERLAFMLEDVQVRVLLTQESLVKSLPEQGCQVVCLDSGWEAITQESAERLVSEVHSSNLAYVIFTSGSTGRPKGVQITHRALVNYTKTATKEYALKPSDSVLQFASMSFDASAEEIYPSLTCGATLVLRTDSMISTVSFFLQMCQDQALTVLSLPTAYWHELMSRLSAEALSLPLPLRLIIIGGERVNPKQWALWKKQVGQRVQLVNTYGPTEATVVATVYKLSNAIETDPILREVPIGRPIVNTQVYVLDRHFHPVPVNVPGEVYIGGVGLARGYLNRPDLTAGLFVPDPLSQKPGARLYKTGDLARYRPDGNLEFMGRVDDQVKIRGYRIELGEVEAVLGAYPSVERAVVVVREDKFGEKRLVAYIIPSDQEREVSISELRTFLKGKLPEYMVPVAFVELDALPLTPNGKVNRRLLPRPDQSRPELNVNYVAPRTLVEEVLRVIWAEVLGIEQLGIHDNFFELGGHSLLATQVISRLAKAFQVELPLRSLFEAPTVADLAALILQDQSQQVSFEEAARQLLHISQCSEENVEVMLDAKASFLEKLLEEDGRTSAVHPREEAEHTLEILDQLSDMEVDSWLDNLLSEEEAGK